MKIKVDENIGKSAIELLHRYGHDVMTVRDQGLGGASDDRVFQACVAERRALVTLDHDFGHALRFPPAQSAGIVILELGHRTTRGAIDERIRAFLNLTRSRSVNGELWIVEPGRVRVRLDKGAD